MLSYIGIGSNLGNRQKNIMDAVKKLEERDYIKIKRLSPIYETEPVGGPKQPKYLNGVIEIDTDLSPRELLYTIQRIEKELGRKKTVRYGPRIIDLDILSYGDRTIDEPDLKIPHPEMNKREFVQKPLRGLIKVT